MTPVAMMKLYLQSMCYVSAMNLKLWLQVKCFGLTLTKWGCWVHIYCALSSNTVSHQSLCSSALANDQWLFIVLAVFGTYYYVILFLQGLTKVHKYIQSRPVNLRFMHFNVLASLHARLRIPPATKNFFLLCVHSMHSIHHKQTLSCTQRYAHTLPWAKWSCLLQT